MSVRRLLASLVALLALVAAAGQAGAHPSAMTYGHATLDGAAVAYRIEIDPADVAVLIGVDSVDPAHLTTDEGAALATTVTGAITLGDGDTVCTAGPATVAPAAGRVAVAWTATCPAPITTFTLTYDLLFADDTRHTAALRVEVTGREPATALLDVDHARFVWPLADAAPSSLPAFVRAGVHHVATGLDHVAFVLTLLLAVVIVRDHASPGGWRLRPLGAALRATALVASAFTLAHSLTLIAAALGWVAVPVVVVESIIALSIVWTAIEDAIRPDVRWRFALTFGFGLVHGLGFARMLAVLLPPSDRILPLLAFNLGVELAHLVVIALALPAMWLVGRAVGAARYRTRVLPVAAGLLAGLGLLWLVERVFGVTVLGV